MYTRLLRKAAHTKKFTITKGQDGVWNVAEEEDNRVIVTVSYRDWRRVERAMETFALKAMSLRRHGWLEHFALPSDGPPGLRYARLKAGLSPRRKRTGTG